MNRRALLAGLALLLPAPTMHAADPPSSSRSRAAAARVLPTLERDLGTLGLRPGAPLALRIFKQSSRLELWAGSGPRQFLFRSYPICAWSGGLGPKLRQGDLQAPEGFYEVGPAQLNPASRFHLSFNLGYPNAYDRHHGRTGDFLMVHGNCVSIGCYAMGDAAIEEIYTLLSAALAQGQRRVPVLILPFAFEPGWRARVAESPWLDFWEQLGAIDRRFVETGQMPAVRVRNGRYRVDA